MTELDQWATVVDLHTVQIVRVADHWPDLKPSFVDELMAETEENLTDLLPAGYRARIRRWDHPDQEGDNPDE